MTTLTVVNAIIHVGQAIAAATSGGSSPGGDAFKKSLDELKKVLFPDEERKVEEKAQRVKEMLSAELDKGPIKITPVDGGQKKGRVRHRRQ